MIPIYKPYIKNYKHSTMDALNTEWISNHGKYIQLSSEKLKSILGTKYCILMNNGTSATLCLFKSIQFKYPNIQKIYVPNNVFVAPWNCCLTEFGISKMEVMKMDEKTMNIDVSEEYVNSLDKNSAVCIVHNYGNIINVPLLKKIRPDLIFVEDNCEGLFGKYGDDYSGTKSLCSSVSFYGNKTITTGEGGAFFTNDDDIYDFINTIYSHGMSNQRYIHNRIGFNFRMTNLQAALLYDQLNDIDHILGLKKKIFQIYDEFFSELLILGKIKKLISEQNTSPSNWLYCIIIPALEYKDLEFFMSENKVEIRPFFYDIHEHEHLKSVKNNHSNTETKKITSGGVSLPSYPELSREQQQYVYICLKKYIELHENEFYSN